MLSIQQLMKALRKLQNNTVAGGDLVKSIKHVAVCANNTNETYKTTIIPVGTTLMTSLHNNEDKGDFNTTTTSSAVAAVTLEQQQLQTNSQSSSNTSNDNNSSQLPLNEQQITDNFHASHNKCFSLYSPLNANSSQLIQCNTKSNANTQDTNFSKTSENSTKGNTISTNSSSPLEYQHNHLTYQQQLHQTSNHHYHQQNPFNQQQQPLRSQSIQNFFQQQIFQHQFHTQHNQNLNTKQKQTQFAMSSLAAEPLTLQKSDGHNGHNDNIVDNESSVSSSATAAATSSSSSSSAAASCPETKHDENSSTEKSCFNTGLADILQFMELIGNLKVS